MPPENKRPNRFAYLQGNQPRRPEDLSTQEKIQQLARNGQIPTASASDLARRQIAEAKQDLHTQKENEMHAKGHHIRARRKSKRKSTKISSYDRQFFGIPD